MKKHLPQGPRESVVVHSRTQQYRAVPLSTEEEDVFMVSTAKKSSVVPNSVCLRCGSRIAKHQVKPCDYCGLELCGRCYEESRIRHDGPDDD